MLRNTDKSNVKTWLVVLIALLDDIAALLLVFVLLWFFDVEIPIPAMIILGLAFGTLIFIIHRTIVPSLRLRRITGAEGMLGMVGEVTETLEMKGIIKVNGEFWQAVSIDGEIEVGEEVEIVGIERLNLEVKRKTS